MVRYARAKGSKGSNDKLPEESTPWQQMKQQMLESQKKVDQPVERLLVKKEDDSSEETTWAKFEETGLNRNAKRSLPNEKVHKSAKKKNKNNGPDNSPSEEIYPETGNYFRLCEKNSNEHEIEGNKYPSSLTNTRKAQFMTRHEKEVAGLPPTRRKPETQSKSESWKMYMGNRELEVCRFDGFLVKKKDCERLKELRKKLKEKNIPEDEIRATLKLERRRAEKSLAQERKRVCFQCREPGHLLSDCPALSDLSGSKANDMPDTANTGLCFKCGSTEHTHFECKVVRDQTFKFATCFVCNKEGHIARQCPDNPQGLYPRGGGCSICGEVTHLRRHCPTSQKEKQSSALTLPTLKNDDALEALDVDNKPVKQFKTPKKKTVVKF